MAVHPIVALACVDADAPHLTELGTSVVPLYGRHPIDVAQQAMTAQTALGGRFTLGIGAASKQQAEGLCRKVGFWRPNPKIGYQKINDLRVSTFLFSVICDRAQRCRWLLSRLQVP